MFTQGLTGIIGFQYILKILYELYTLLMQNIKSILYLDDYKRAGEKVTKIGGLSTTADEGNASSEGSPTPKKRKNETRNSSHSKFNHKIIFKFNT